MYFFSLEDFFSFWFNIDLILWVKEWKFVWFGFIEELNIGLWLFLVYYFILLGFYIFMKGIRKLILF